MSIRVTDLCNLRCHTCGQWGDHGHQRERDVGALGRCEVPVARYEAELADLLRHGHRPIVYLWGGEPMLYDGVVDLVEAASRLKLPTAIATNGTRIAAVADRLVRAPLFLLQVSIDGDTAALHDRLRPSANGGDNFKEIRAALAAVRRARAVRGSSLPIVASLTVVSKGNQQHLVDIYDAFRDSVDVFVFYLSWWIDREDAGAHATEFARRFGFAPACPWGWIGDWRPDDFEDLDRQLRAVKARGRPLSAPAVTVLPALSGVDDLRAYYTHHPERFGYDRCASIYQAVEIGSNGDVSPCRDYHDYVVGNLRDATIADLWNAPAYRAFRRSLATDGLMPACTRCCGLMGY